MVSNNINFLLIQKKFDYISVSKIILIILKIK